MPSKTHALKTFIICGSAIGSCLCVLGVQRGDLAPAPIPIQEVQRRGIAGWLGQPLGTYIRVEGTIIDGDTLSYKAARGLLFLRPESVAGRKVIDPTDVPLPFDTKKELKLKPGDRIKCIGWETGGCRGTVNDPDNLNNFRARGLAPVANAGYGFYTEFHITKIE